MYSIDIKNNKEIYEYCMHNGITDINKFVQDCFKQGYDIKKYGLLGKTLNEGEKDLIKEVIVEKQVEVPVEIIKEVEKIVEVIKEVEVPVTNIVEKIVEVPVEKIVEKVVEIVKEVPVDKVVIKEVVKEVPVEKVVEKEIYITDDNQVNELLSKIQQLESDKQIVSTKIGEYETERQIFSTKMEEMENIFQNKMSKKDKELDELRHSLDELLAKPPVEVVKEVEKIVEVPVEKIVTNTEYIRDENVENQLNEKLKLLQETLQNLRSELQQKNEQIKELEKINRELLNGPNQGYLLRGSNLNRRI